MNRTTKPLTVPPGTAEQLARIDPSWRTVPGYPRYAVSDSGQVLFFPKDSRSRVKELRGSDSGRGYRWITLCWRPDGQRRRVYLHALVAELFIGPRPDGMDVRHLDGDPTNNHVINLTYGTRSENILDTVRHGTHNEARRTQCEQGHPFSGDNLVMKGRRRCCRTCLRRQQATADRRHYLRSKAASA